MDSLRIIDDWRKDTFDEIIDVRSPAEYFIDHIPGSSNIAILNDEERSLVGTLYKTNTFKAKVLFDVDLEVLFPTDSIAIIASEGLLGGNFLEIIPGGSPDELEPGDTMEFSQDAVDISQLLGKFMFSAAGNDQK